MAPAREAGSAGDMTEVPQGRGFAGLVCWASMFRLLHLLIEGINRSVASPQY